MGDVFIFDFDGTLVTRDVGDDLCDRFADPSWRDIDAAWERRELSLHQAQRRTWALVKADEDELLAWVREHVRLRSGLDSLLDRLAARGARLVLASGGFGFYIEAVLHERLRRFEALFYNRATFDRGSVSVDFPHLGTLGCDLCPVCKGRVCDRFGEGGARVTFIGDGTSDRCAIGRADRLFAVRGSKLARAAGPDAIEFESFDEID